MRSRSRAGDRPEINGERRSSWAEGTARAMSKIISGAVQDRRADRMTEPGQRGDRPTGVYTLPHGSPVALAVPVETVDCPGGAACRKLRYPTPVRSSVREPSPRDVSSRPV